MALNSLERVVPLYWEFQKRRPKEVNQLIREIIQSSYQTDPTRDLRSDSRLFLELSRVELDANYHEKPAGDGIVVLAPNHLSRTKLFSTYESFNAATVTTVAEEELDLRPKAPRWLIKYLPTKGFGPGMLARKLQNASVDVYGSIPVKVTKDQKFGNLDEVRQKIAEACIGGTDIGFFPEQLPSKKLQQYHRAFPGFLRGLKAFGQPVEIVPVSIFYEKKTAVVNFGKIVRMAPDQDENQAAKQTMLTIASNLPAKLHGHYARQL